MTLGAPRFALGAKKKRKKIKEILATQVIAIQQLMRCGCLGGGKNFKIILYN
jgi:hypothetical protein